MVHARLWQLAREIPGLLALAVIAGLLASALSIGQVLAVASAITAIVTGDWDMAGSLLGVAGGLVIVRALLTSARAVLTAWVAGRVRGQLRAVLLSLLAGVGQDGVAEKRAGTVRSTLTEGVDSLAAYYSIYLPQLIVSSVVPIAVVAGIWTVHAPAGVVVGVAVVLSMVIPRWKDRELVRVGRLRWDAHYDLAADYLEAMHAMATLRSFGADGRTRDALQGRSQRLYRATMQELRVSLVENGVTAFVVQVGTATAVAFTAFAVTGTAVVDAGAGRSAAATVVLVGLLAAECFRPISELSTAWHAGYLGVTAIDGVDAILGAPIPLPDNGSEPAPWTDHPPQVQVRNVVVRYAGANHHALDGVDLDLSAGSVTALVGPSGAGKSTLGKILVRLRDPDSGSVQSNGVDLREISLDALRSSGVAWVEQHPFLLTGTIRSNLLLTRPDADDAQLLATLSMVGAGRFVAALPRGLDEPLDENGGNLSGGQRQRLALARALLADPKFLVLDEATSNLDELGAGIVTDALLALRARCTTVVIVHRMSTAMLCDHVVVLDGGKVVQHGEPADLAGRTGLFAEQLAAQHIEQVIS